MQYEDLGLFTRGYVEALLWTECSDGEFDPENGSPLPQGATFDDFAPETISQIIVDCASFEMANKRLLSECGDDGQNGHDFWLTRNGHGVGFWDRGYGKAGELISDKARAFREVSVYLGDDGKIYLS